MYAKLHLYFQKAYIKSIRLFIFFFLTSLITYQVSNNQSPRIALFLFNLFLINEIFFRYKINKMVPHLTVNNKKGKNVCDYFTLPAASVFLSEKNTHAVIKKIIKYPHIKRLLQKANIQEKEILAHNISISMKVLASSSLEVSRALHGKFVTTLDIYVAYLMLTEGETKLFFAKQLKTDDLNNILFWLRTKYADEENPTKHRMHFSGGGIGEFLIAGWTPESKKYVFNFTNHQALKNKAIITGREKEFKAMLEGLIKVESNNILLVGDIGSGKENLVKAFAYHSFEGNVGSFLNYHQVFEIMVGAFIAGATNRNEVEARLQSIISEISHAVDIILYIPEFENIMGTSSYGLDLSGALLPYLQSGNLPIIATISKANYKLYLERNPIKEVFTIIELKEPDKNTAIQMVMQKTNEIEKKNKVIVSYRAVASAVELANRFLQDSVLPGNAISLLESVANKVSLSEIPYFEHTHKKIVLERWILRFCMYQASRFFTRL